MARYGLVSDGSTCIFLDRVGRIREALQTDTFRLCLEWVYRRDSDGQHMMFLILDNCTESKQGTR